MATLDNVITLPRLRDAVGGISDSDTELDPYRKAAIAWLEKYTGRVIVDRTNRQSPPDAFGYSLYPDMIWFWMPDIKSDATITLNHSTPMDDPAGRPSQTEAITLNDDARRTLLDFDGLILYGGAPDALWNGKIRYDHPTPYITVSTQGMDSADIPAEWGQAVALIVRALYDGTAYDDIGKHSSLKLLLMPWTPTERGGLRRL